MGRVPSRERGPASALQAMPEPSEAIGTDELQGERKQRHTTASKSRHMKRVLRDENDFKFLDSSLHSSNVTYPALGCIFDTIYGPTRDDDTSSF